MLYMIYRWVVFLYFGGYLFAYGAILNGPKFMIYLTNWSYIALNLGFFYAALSTTVEYLMVYVCCRRHYNELHFERDADEFNVVKPKGCFSSKYNQIKWYHMIQWVLSTVGNQAAVCVVILYWALLFRGGTVTLYDGHFHLGNGLIGLVDVFISGLPVRILHFYMIQSYAATYSVFTGIYYVAGGTGNNGTSYIYGPLNYEENPGFAVGLVIGILVVIPLIHLAFFGVYICRFWLVYLLYGFRRQPRLSQAHELAEEEHKTNYVSSTFGVTEEDDDVY